MPVHVSAADRPGSRVDRELKALDAAPVQPAASDLGDQLLPLQSTGLDDHRSVPEILEDRQPLKVRNDEVSGQQPMLVCGAEHARVAPGNLVVPFISTSAEDSGGAGCH